MPVREAITLARHKGLDLVEIAPNSDPPVCKIMDFGKYKYEMKKKAQDARKKQKVIEVKEIKLRPNISTNDFQVKLRSIIKFLGEGNKVKISLKFRGREAAHNEIGFKLFEQIQEQSKAYGKAEFGPKMERGQMLMILVAN